MYKTMKDSNIKHDQNNQSSSEEHSVRLQKLEAIKKAGFQPWPAVKKITSTSKDVLDTFDESSNNEYSIAGRIMSMRFHGKTMFAHLQDRTGKLQVYIRKDIIGDVAFEHLEHFIDIGDIVWVTGTAFRTQKGEVTLKVTAYTLESKCLYPLPEKFHGLSDIETIYRQRYLDLMTNAESQTRFQKRSKIITVMRAFFDAHDFMEVETPILHPIPGGAAARPFVTHHNALDSEFFLRIAPELYLKQLVIGGFERVYEVGRVFRNEGVSTRHNPEFTMVEWYMAHQDYHYMMGFVEEMFKKMAMACNNSLHFTYGNYEIDFQKPFARLSMHEAVMQYANYTYEQLDGNAIDNAIKEHNIVLANKDASWGEKLYALFEELVESKLIQPTFITKFPIEVSPLAKRDSENPEIAARFELFIACMEISNGFNELNDPFDQAERFKQQAEARTAGDTEAHHYDADYIHALEYGLPPTVGVGVGIDRLVMLITNTTSIKDIILFPTLRKR
jgi:lysyl-tRNA synthetase class 2